MRFEAGKQHSGPTMPSLGVLRAYIDGAVITENRERWLFRSACDYNAERFSGKDIHTLFSPRGGRIRRTAQGQLATPSLQG